MYLVYERYDIIYKKNSSKRDNMLDNYVKYDLKLLKNSKLNA